MNCSSALRSFTFASEGSSDPASRYFSRDAHVPAAQSGVTIGRGYDLGSHSPEEIHRDLLSAGLSVEFISLAKKAASLRGKSAAEFLKRARLPRLSSDSEARLFCLSYNRAEEDVKRISSQESSVRAFGALAWDMLHPAIRDVLIDLRFRGDYTAKTRRLLQRCAAANDLRAFYAAISDRANWPSVPEERFKARVRAVLTALGKQSLGTLGGS